jgi:hypothetical protein
MEGNQSKEQREKTVNVRFSLMEWDLIEKARINYGVRTRGNIIRFLLVPKLKEIQQEVNSQIA